MRLGILSAVLLVMSSAAFAADNQLVPSMQPTTLVRWCAPGFVYSVKEQMNNPPGHLWYICRADITCSGMLAGTTQGAANSFRFVYSCSTLQPAGNDVCAPGFAKGNVAIGAVIPGCVTPAISCPAKFMPMGHTATLGADKHSERFEYQCYRPTL